MSITKKPERVRFDRDVRRLLTEFGAVKTDDDYAYRLSTPLGGLRVSIHESRDAPGPVMMRFDTASDETTELGANNYTGKWNHHFRPGVSCDAALSHVRQCLERVTELRERLMDTKKHARYCVICKKVYHFMWSQKKNTNRECPTCTPDQVFALAKQFGIPIDGIDTHEARRRIDLVWVPPEVADIPEDRVVEMCRDKGVPVETYKSGGRYNIHGLRKALYYEHTWGAETRAPSTI